MKILQFDIIEGFKKDGIMAFEGDNKSESYLITLLKNKRRYILSDKTVKMIMLNKETKEGDFFEIEIINPEKGEIKIDVTDKLTKEDGRFVCQLIIDGTNGFKENSVLFYVSIKKSLVNEISGEIIADPSFKILTDALVKVDEWSKYFEETSGKIEEKYTERLNIIDDKIYEIEKNPITKYGAVADGITPCDDAFYNATKNNKNIYFPQNETKNAKYFFTYSRNFEGLNVYSDDDVIISMPDNFSSIKGEFYGGLYVESRDREGTNNEILKDSNPTYYSLIGGDLDLNCNGNNVESIDKSIIKGYTLAGGVLSEQPIQENENMYSVSKTGGSIFIKEAISGYKYDALVQGAGNSFFRIIVSDGINSSYMMYSDKIYYVEYLNGIKSEIIEEFKYRKFVDDSKYNFNADFVCLSARIIDRNTYEVYINDTLVKTLKTNFNIEMIGFSETCGRFTKSFINNSFVSDSLNIATFGDSIDRGDSGGSWTKYAKDMLLGKYGINKINFDVYAVGGNTSAQQLEKMKTVDLSNYDLVTVKVGTNDALQGVTLSNYSENLKSMIDLALNSQKRVVIGIPPFSVNKSQTGIGADFGNAQKFAKYRQEAKRVVSLYDTDVVIVDIPYETGRMGIDNHTELIHDNVHYKMLGEIIIARAFSKGIVKVFSNNLRNYKEIISINNNVKAIVNSNSVTIDGVIKLDNPISEFSEILKLPINFPVPNYGTNKSVISCLAKDDSNYDFVPVFIDSIAKGIYCYGNVKGTLKYITEIWLNITYTI